MSHPRLPWEPGYVPPTTEQELVDQITGVVQGVAGPAGAAVVTDVAGVVQSVTSSPTGGGDVLPSLEKAAQDAVQGAVNAAIPDIQKRIAAEATQALTNATSGLPPAQVPHISLKDLTKLDAWERAGRTFLSGIYVTILAAIVQVVGALASDGTNIDWFHKDGWTAVGTLAVGSVVTALSSYLLRLLREPVGASIDSSKPATTG